MSDVFRRIGRGGAGNFIPQTDTSSSNPTAMNPTEIPASKDFDAQKLPVPAVHVASQPQHYARVGRGGAGNFYDATNAPERSEQEAAESTGTDEVTNASGSKKGYKGRGGLGNWSDVTMPEHEAQRQKMEALETKIVADVDAGLAVPPKAHTPAPKEEE